MTSPCIYQCYRTNKNIQNPTVKRTDTIELIFFDMDGVLTDTLSSWKYIHDYFGTSNERSVDMYLRGDIDDKEFIRRDLSLWKEQGKPARSETIKKVLLTINNMNGAAQCLSYLHKKKIKTAIISAGLDILAEKVAKDLGITYVFANGIQNDEDGRLTGEGILRVQLMHKDKNIRQLTKKLDIPLNRCAAIGNSCFDISMFETCGFSIAFNPEDNCVKEAADVVVEGKDLRRILPVLDPFLR